MKRISSAVAVATIVASVVVGVAGLAGATTKRHGPPTGTPTGTNACSVNAVLSFSPPLSSTAATSANSTVSLSAQFVRCNARPKHGRTTGHVAVSNAGTVPTDTCTLPSTAPTFSGLKVRWTPPSQVAGSTVAAPTAGTITTLGAGNAQVAYTGLAVTGSFATSSGRMTLDTTDRVAALQAACQASQGLAAISLRGTASL